MKHWYTAVVFFAAVPAFAASAGLSDKEQKEIDARIRRFYRAPVTDGSVMNERVPKFDVNRGDWSKRKSPLAPNRSEASPLKALGGLKSSAKYHRARCESVYKRYFPELYESECTPHGGTWATVEGNDKVDSLAYQWMPPEQVAYHLDFVPASGTTELPLWSDDYWRTMWGLTSYRYSEHKSFSTYKEAVAHYAQPAEWLGIAGLSPEATAGRIVRWSPAEKYDLSVGDDGFRLTNEQKKEGEDVMGPGGTVEAWMGICHGWAAASIAVTPPIKATTVIGARNMPVTWYPADIKALTTLAWANGNYASNFVGGRCNGKAPETHPNGRIKDQKCFDNNPATFHLSLGNLIGKQKASFVMDKTYDYEVWNQPVSSYQFTYFNPMDPSKKSQNWRDVLVEYNEAFRAQDRFQNPPTRGVRGAGGVYDDKNVRQIVGVIATVTYLVEIFPGHSPSPDRVAYERVTYTYDLEFHEHSGELYPMGGEWHQNSHPDFLWVPRKGSFAKSNYDNVKVKFTGDAMPEPVVTETARNASNIAMPLCRVVKELLRRTTAEDKYTCPQ